MHTSGQARDVNNYTAVSCSISLCIDLQRHTLTLTGHHGTLPDRFYPFTCQQETGSVAINPATTADKIGSFVAHPNHGCHTSSYVYNIDTTDNPLPPTPHKTQNMLPSEGSISCHNSQSNPLLTLGSAAYDPSAPVRNSTV
jgi:hypothetical protein